MTSADLKDLVPAHAQEQLEWVTPKISLLDAGDTDSKFYEKNERTATNGVTFGPVS